MLSWGSSRPIGLLAALAACTFANVAHSAGDPRAEALFREGLDLTDRGDWDAACPKFAASQAAEPSVGALLNLAACSERTGKLLEARARYAEALKLNATNPNDERRKAVNSDVDAALAALGRRVAHLGVSVTPSTASLTIDGQPATTARVDVDPGDHVVRAETPGLSPAEKRVHLSEGESTELRLELSPAASGDGPSTGRGGPVRSSDAGGMSTTTLSGLITLLGGVAVGGVGAGLLGVTASKASDVRALCGDEARPPVCNGTSDDAAEATDLSASARSFEIAGGVLAAVGGAAVAVGATFLIVGATGDDSPNSDQRSDGANSTSLRVDLGVGPGSVKCGIDLRF